MFSKVTWNVVVVIAIVLVSFAPYLWAPQFMPEHVAKTTSFIVMPFALGVVVNFAMRCALPVKIAAVGLIPLSHLFYFGHDPAKPYVANLFALIEYGVVVFGLCASYVFVRIVKA